DAVALEPDVVRVAANAHANALRRQTGLDDFVVDEHHRLGRALDVDRRALVAAVVGEAILEQPIAMAGKVLATLGPKQHADVPAVANLVLGHQVVGVAMADGDTDPVAVDGVLLGQAVSDAPAEEDADVIAAQRIVADDWPLRAGAGVQAKL